MNDHRPSRLLAGLSLALACPGPAFAQPADDRPERYAYQPDALVAQSMRHDLDYLETMFGGANLSFASVPGSRERFQAEIAALRARLPGLSYAHFVMGISKAVATVDDGHTAASWDGLRLAPVRLLWFGDELRVVMARPAHRALLGARVLAVGDRPVGAVLKAMAAYIPGNDERVRAQSVQLFASPDALHGMDLIGKADDLPLTLLLADGKRRTVRLSPEPAARPGTRAMPWQDAVPVHRLREPGWVHLLDDLAALPPYLQEGDRFYAPAVLPGLEDVFYYRARATRDQDASIVAAGGAVVTPAIPLRDDLMINGLGAMADRKTPYAHAIVDLRYNGGGNYFNFVEFAKSLPGLLAPGGKVFIVTNNQTFSAAIVATALLKYHAQDRAVIVGEHVGDRERFWAETYALTLPGSGLRVGAARGYHDWATGCRPADLPAPCWGINRVLAVPAGSLAPTLPVVTTFDDYRKGVDPALSAIKASLGR